MSKLRASHNYKTKIITMQDKNIGKSFASTWPIVNHDALFVYFEDGAQMPIFL